jgi:Protein of unknown function (DUF2723)
VRSAVGSLAVLFLAAHLAFLPPTLEDLDSVNFALGVRDFDVALHQPHPPGYPVFIALAKLSTSALALAGVPAPEVRGLAVWSALGGALLLVGLFGFFRAVGGDRDEAARRAAIAVLFVACCPLVWFNSARPMSDLAGLAAAFAALCLWGQVFDRWRPGLGPSAANDQRPGPEVGAFLATVAIGFRSQMAVLTLPMLLLVLVVRRRRAVPLLAAAVAGALVWAVPLLVLSGGPAGYLAALGSQAGADFTGVVMLWTHPTPRVALDAVLHTFVRPWASPILGGVMLSLAAAGVVVLVERDRRSLVLLAVAFGPYAVFHLLFQEPLTNRYALPLVPLTAYLAAAALASANGRAPVIATASLAVAALTLAVPPTLAFGRQPSPFFALMSEMRMIEQRGAQPVVGMHRRVFTESRRARVYAGELPGTLLATPRDFEWLEMTRAWRDGHQGETWFIADPRRTDLALIDRAHARVRQYRWPFASALYVGGTRPDELDWHVFHDPGWFLEHGWALTPEIAGIAEREGWGPHKRPSVGWIRRRPESAVMMIGGRHLGGGPPARVVARIDDRPVATLDVRPGFFLEFVRLPAGTLAGEDRFARLTVAADAPGGAAPPVAIEQFNVQGEDGIQFGFDEGWYEPEYNPATARSWRWMGERSMLRIHNAGKAVTVRLRGEAPRRYFDAAPVVRVSAGDRVLSETRPFADFTIEVSVPADVLAAAGGRVLVSSDRAFVAGDREGTADRRRLALRVYAADVAARRP